MDEAAAAAYAAGLGLTRRPLVLDRSMLGGGIEVS
jgi:hypothetical protein